MKFGSSGRFSDEMSEYYWQIKWVHVATVAATGVLFGLRGAATMAGSGVAFLAPVRYLSYAIDTALLASALMLMTVVHQYPFVHAWLTAKVVLLILYILLGSCALKRGKSHGMRAICFVAASATYLSIVTVALVHNLFDLL